ncbi:hypothetical protein HDE_06479 [Halotydeus destructor]|nr:hypothetical protein HDE_06479 [Halotydeus destructor]
MYTVRSVEIKRKSQDGDRRATAVITSLSRHLKEAYNENERLLKTNHTLTVMRTRAVSRCFELTCHLDHTNLELAEYWHEALKTAMKHEEEVKGLSTTIHALGNQLSDCRKCEAVLKTKIRNLVDDKRETGKQLSALKGINARLLAEVKESQASESNTLKTVSGLEQEGEDNLAMAPELQGVEKQLRTAESADDELKETLTLFEDKEKFCPICLVPYFELESSGNDLVALASCGHVLCSACLESHIQVREACPMCQAHILPDQRIKLYF